MTAWAPRRKADRAPPAAAPRTSGTSDKAPAAVKIAVAEDEGVVGLHLKRQLASFGYEVAEIVLSDDDAATRLEQIRPDLVVIDAHAPDAVNGTQAPSRVPPGLRIPAIYLTTQAEQATLETLRIATPHGFLVKPYSERELRAMIEMVLGRARAEAALSASEDRFRSIVAAISEGVFIVDPSTGCFSNVNEAGSLMFGYAQDELIGREVQTISSGAPAYTRREGAAWIEKAANSGLPQRFRWHCKTKDGRLFWAEIAIRFATIGEESVVLAVARDLTESLALGEQLRQAQKMEAIGQLTGGIAHDFNNLLAVIIGNLDLISDARPDDLEVRELAGEALAAALAGADLTRGLLAFARSQPLTARSIDLKELLTGAARLLRRLLGDQIIIDVDCADDVGFVLADRAQLESAITNLAVNARDAMPSGGGVLSFTAAPRRLDAEYAARNTDVAIGDYAMIEVTDTGTGMNAEVMRHIFEPFFTTKSRENGTGLGLSMVFGFLKQSGGHVSVYSEVGVGTTFRLYLPRTPEEKPAKAIRPRKTPANVRGKTVLVVEDSAALRRIAARQLKDLGCVVIEAATAAAALALLERREPDVLFTDVVLPGDMNGFDLGVAAAALYPKMKVILTSGFPRTRSATDRARSRFPLLTKPYRADDLARILGRVLRTRQPTPALH